MNPNRIPDRAMRTAFAFVVVACIAAAWAIWHIV
jgi:hypothetical protein